MTDQPSTLRQEIHTICIENGGYPEKWPRHSECPACGKQPLSPHFFKYGFAHAQCKSCGFVAVDPFPPDEIMTQLYTGTYYTNLREYFEKPMLLRDEEMPFSAPRAVLDTLIAKGHRGSESGRWLDVGGGLGAFAHLVQRTLPDWSVALNEINPQSAAIAREILNLDVVDLEPETLSASGERYDVISCISVIEHLPRPAEFLKRYVNLLVAGGSLIVVVPHFTHLNASVSKGSSANVVPPYHVSLFNRESLRLLIEQIPGLQLESLEEAGPPAFNLFDHVQFGDHWDISTPTAEDPRPRSIKIQEYEKDANDALNALGEVNDRLKEYFAKTDGRMYLIAYCKYGGSPAGSTDQRYENGSVRQAA